MVLNPKLFDIGRLGTYGYLSVEQVLTALISWVTWIILYVVSICGYTQLRKFSTVRFEYWRLLQSVTVTPLRCWTIEKDKHKCNLFILLKEFVPLDEFLIVLVSLTFFNSRAHVLNVAFSTKFSKDRLRYKLIKLSLL